MRSEACEVRCLMRLQLMVSGVSHTEDFLLAMRVLLYDVSAQITKKGAWTPHRSPQSTDLALADRTTPESLQASDCSAVSRGPVSGVILGSRAIRAEFGRVVVLLRG